MSEDIVACVICARPATVTTIDHHHVVPRSLDPSRVWDVSNLVPLCRVHHDEVHQKLMRIEKRGDELDIYRHGELVAIVPVAPISALEWDLHEALFELPSADHMHQLYRLSPDVLKGIFELARERRGTTYAWMLAVVWALYRRLGWLGDEVDIARAIADFLGIPAREAVRLVPTARRIFQDLRRVYGGFTEEWQAAVQRALYAPETLTALVAVDVEKLTRDVADKIIYEEPRIPSTRVPRVVSFIECPQCGYRDERTRFRVVRPAWAGGGEGGEEQT